MRTNLPLRKTVLTTFAHLVLALFSSFYASSLHATDFVVTNGNNAGAGSLRQAITDANANAAVPHNITFTVTGVINITSSLPTIARQVVIDGGNTVTISGPGGDNTIALFVLGTGSGGSIIRNLIMRNTGIEPIRLSVALNNITIENMLLTYTGSTHYMNRGILVNAAVTNLTIKNVQVTNLQDNFQGMYFSGNVTNLLVDGFKISGGGGGTASAILFQGIVNGFTLKNSTLDMDDPATEDDGNYGVYFATTASNVTIDSSTFRDNEVYAVYCGGGTTNFLIKNSQFDNLDGWTKNVFAYFKTNTNGVTIDKNIFDSKYRSGTNDGDYGIQMIGVSNQNLNILNNKFNDSDTSSFWLGQNHANSHDNVLIKGNTFIRNGYGGATGAVDFITRNTTSDGGAVLITENTFIDNNGISIFVHPYNTTTYVVPNFIISKNIIYNTKSTYGAIRINYVDKISITQNSIYNNQGLGIELAGVANCGYEGANTPQILSSTETSPGSGVYNIGVKMPAICGSGNCSVEIFSNEAGTKGVGGQHYVTIKTGVASGNQTLTGVTGSFAEITSAPYGTWTATLKLNNNCATSEFSNKKAIKPNGPAGINNGIAVWLRGDDLSVNNAEPTSSGQVITGWEEFSGGGGPSATTIISNPLTKLNGINFNPVADMDNDGIRGILPNGPSWITTPTTTSVAVFNPLSITPSGDRFYCLFSQAGSDYNVNTAQIEFYRTGNIIQAYRGNTAITPQIPGTAGVKAFDRPGVFSSVTSATNHTSYYNGANMGSANYNKGNFAISQWFVGTGWNTTDGWQGGAETDFAEVFTYNRVLSAIELQKVQSYMALKYGIAMKQNYVLSDGTQVWDVTANATHSKEIAALARDNVSVLHQKQAKAFHTDEVVSIASGNTLAPTNNDNADSIINNLSVFMWGNDSASTAFATAFTAGTYSSTRMTRVWKVLKTNWADKDITIQLNNGKVNNYLLISTDPTFATITQELQLNSSGTVTLSSALLGSGTYFTFGRQQKSPGGVSANLTVWVKADEGVNKNGNDAVTWEDQGSSQRIWAKTSATPINWTSSSFNYNPVVQFTGTNYYRFNQFVSTYTQGEVFSVQSSAVNNVASFPWQLGGTSGATGVVYRWTDNNMYLHFGTNARRNFLFGTKNMALPVILNVNTITNSWTASLDGKIMSGPSTYPTDFTSAGLVYNYIGAGHVSIFNGPIPEVILYNRKLTTPERLRVNSYLALKYGITIDQTSPADYIASDGTTTMWKASDNTGFTTNIAGIGRDEIGTLYQKQSRSINTAASGNLIAIAVGGELAISNADNTDTIVNNKSFLVWGDNNAASTYTSNISATNVTVRMPRVWKVDKTNWADRDITIKLHGNITNTYLLINNSNAGFATIDQELPINADSTITINSSLLPDGAYFTFGREILGPGFVNSNIVTWQRADDGQSNNSTWFDYSGNGNDASQVTIADQPGSIAGSSAGAINFNPGYQFTTGTEWFDYDNDLTLNGTANKTVLWVAKSNAATAAAQAVLSHSLTGTNTFLVLHDNSNRPASSVGGGGSTCGPVSPSAFAFNTPLIGTYSRTSTTSATMFTNGGFPFTSLCNSNFVGQNMRIGARSTTAFNPFNGNIAEVVVYNSALTPLQLQRVHSYFALKYGITLDQATATDYVATDWDGSIGTKMWTASKNGIYNKGIAGIGRDDKTALYQRQSRSVSDTLITIAAGSAVMSDNLSNAAEIDDLTFFTWADNNLATTFSVAVTGGNATSRMPRVWKVDRTNWADQDITIKATQGGDRYLLVNATDPTFATGNTEYAITTATGTVTINTSNLPDGAYFTLATKIAGPACVNNGIVAWLRADYGSEVNSWVDFSGNQTNATQATAANQPSVLSAGLNYNTALQFNGTSDYLQIPQSSIAGKFSFGNNARTLIGVGANLTNTDQLLFSYGSFISNQASGLRTSANRTAFEGFGPTNGVVGPINSFPTNKPGIISGRYAGGAAGAASIYMNSTTAGTTLPMSWATTISAEGAQVGKYVGENRWWNGNIGEVIVYNRNLTDAEFQRVSSYLSLKYGITLNQTIATDYIASDGTTRMWTAADNTGYATRITGIGRDDCTELYQKQSLSVDTGIVAIAIGDVVEVNNKENLNTIDNNNSYFVFADNNASSQYNTPVSGLQNITTSMARIWKVDKTNWTDAGVTFKLTGGNDKIYMLISTADAVFDGSDAAYQLDAAGNITIPTDDIPDGAYFTFAKTLNGPGYVNVGVQLWLRADDNISTTETWYDYSGNDNNANQATVGLQPVFNTNTTNYNPGFVFDGTSQNMSLDISKLPVGTTARTLIGVGTPANITGSRYMIGWGAAITSQYSALANQAANGYLLGWANDVFGPAAVINSPEELFGTWAGAGGNASLYSKMKLVAGPTAKVWNTGISAGAHIGMLTGNTAYWSGPLNEIVVYNRALTNVERLRISSYLAMKHGYTIDQVIPNNYVATDWDGVSGTVYWDATVNATYKNNITGIGRDDNTGLYQKQSRNVNTTSNGNMIAIGLTAIEATNKDNTATFANDMEFLVWGDDGLNGTKTIEYPAALDPGGCSKITRLQREWKVQKTGTVGDVRVQVYLAGLVPMSTGQSDLRLLIDDDGDFSTGVTTIINATSYDVATQVARFDGINFTSGQHFTIVTDLTNQAPGGVITNLYTWYRADKGVNTATGVSVLADQSVSAKDVTQGTAGAQPVYNTTANLVNFNPALSLDGADVLSNAAVAHSAAGGEDIFAVVLPNNVAGFHDIVGLGTAASTNTATELRFNANRIEYLSNNGGVQSITNPATSNGIVQLANGHRTNAGAATLLLNGNTVASGTINQLPAATQLNIGARRAAAANSFFFNGQVAEVAVYNRDLTLIEREKVASYLAIKYGITLPHNYVDPGGTVVWDATTNTGYGFNITGIGRDDCNGLHQKQSKSVNTAEALVTLGNYIGITTTNAGNSNNLDNNTSLLLGDNNGNRTAWVATGAPLNRERIARTWRVQKRGNISTVTIQVPANSSSVGVKLPLEKDGIVYLLIKSTNDFTTGATEVPMVLNGDNWETTYDFTSGDYFTFATNNACVSSEPILSNYNAITNAATDKCYVNGWILFRDPVDASKYIAAIYDPLSLIDRTKITAKIEANAAFADLGETDGVKAARLMRRLLQVNCNDCFDAIANPSPAFIVRMFYSPDEKSGAESIEVNNMIAIKTAGGIVDPHFFKWFKASEKTAQEVVNELTPGQIAAGGQEWNDGSLVTGQLNGVDYVDFSGVNSFSTFGGIWAVNVVNVLPVTWLDVQAIPMGDHINIRWGTAAEIDNRGFVVERSVDGQGYQAVASVPSQTGNTGSPSYYSVDDNTVEQGVLYYYRIKQTDFGGRVSYSKVVTARLSSVHVNLLRIKPNPVSAILRWELHAAISQDFQADIIDVTGRVVNKIKVNAQTGINQYTMNVSGLSSGTYLLRMTGKDRSVKTEKFMIP